MLTLLLQRNRLRQIVFFIILFLITTSIAYAADVSPEYKPLVGIPGLTNLDQDTPLPEYINQIYLLIIVVGALLGVMRLAWAGVKYSLSDVVTEKSEAKHDMTGVLMGLAILLIPFVVLKEINPNLVNLNVFHEAQFRNTQLLQDLDHASVTQLTVRKIDLSAYSPIVTGRQTTMLRAEEVESYMTQVIINVLKRNKHPRFKIRVLSGEARTNFKRTKSPSVFPE